MKSRSSSRAKRILALEKWWFGLRDGRHVEVREAVSMAVETHGAKVIAIRARCDDKELRPAPHRPTDRTLEIEVGGEVVMLQSLHCN